MLLKHIFGPEGKSPPETDEGLWAVESSKGGNCFIRFRAFFRDPSAVFRFCKEHLDDLRRCFGASITPSKAAIYFVEEFNALMQELIAASRSTEVANNLQALFKPLFNNDPTIRVLQSSKARYSDRIDYKISPKIRIYAIRINPGTYIMTGFAIKLTDAMQERKHTNDELNVIKKVLNWLKDENVEYPEDLIRLA